MLLLRMYPFAIRDIVSDDATMTTEQWYMLVNNSNQKSRAISFYHNFIKIVFLKVNVNENPRIVPKTMVLSCGINDQRSSNCWLSRATFVPSNIHEANPSIVSKLGREFVATYKG